LTVSEQTIVGRITGGNIAALTASQVRTLLALVIGTNVQAWDADLDAVAGLAPTNDDIIQRKAGVWTNRTIAQLVTDLGLGTVYQPLDSDLTAVAALSPSNDDIVQRKAGAWTNRTIAQLLTDLGIATNYQPLDTDLTSIAALTTTSYGRALLTLANAAAGDWITKALIDAKGDLIAGTAADTSAVLTVGANDTILMADSGQTTGLKWVAPATPSTQALGDAAAEGTADTYTRGDHKHAFPTATTVLGAISGVTTPTAGNFSGNVNTVAATGSTETLDTTVYAVHDCTMDQNCTFTFSNPAASGKNTTFVLVLRGAFTPTLPGSVKWSSGSVPTYTTPSVYVFTTVDAGTTYYAQQVGRAFA
jgi:hypothetical protein